MLLFDYNCDNDPITGVDSVNSCGTNDEDGLQLTLRVRQPHTVRHHPFLWPGYEHGMLGFLQIL